MAGLFPRRAGKSAGSLWAAGLSLYFTVTWTGPTVFGSTSCSVG